MAAARTLVSYCAVHGCYETAGNCYQACFECGHVWQTEDEFRADVRQLYNEMWDGDPAYRKAHSRKPSGPRNMANVLVCPHCAHDL